MDCNDEHIDIIPNKETEYLCSPHDKSSEFTYLMKLVLSCKSNANIALDKIKKTLNDNPNCLNDKNKKGWTALMLACCNADTSSSLNIVKYLLSMSDINLNDTNNEGFTALMLACCNADTSSSLNIVKYLLSMSDINLNDTNNEGFTALMLACNSCSLETVKCLLSKTDIDINKYSDGTTALTVVCRSFNRYCSSKVKLLLDTLLNTTTIDVGNNFCNFMYHLFDDRKFYIKYKNIILNSLISCVHINDTHLSEFIFDKLFDKKIMLNNYDTTTISNAFIIYHTHINSTTDLKSKHPHSTINSVRIIRTLVSGLTNLDKLINILLYLSTHKARFENHLLCSLLQFSSFNMRDLCQLYYVYNYRKYSINAKIQNHRLHMLSHPNNTLGLCDKLIGCSDFFDINDLFNLKEFDKLKLLFSASSANDLIDKANKYTLYVEKIE